MPPYQPLSRPKPLLPAIVFAAILAFVLWAYCQALGGTWHFDDTANLGGLNTVKDLPSAVQFILGGRAGPTGRPVALLSFALQADAWPDRPEAMLLVNAVIHVINGLLVFLVSFQLARLVAMETVGRTRQLWFAALAASAWVLSPFLASASLMAVQRMTTLSATFLFAGMAVYLFGRMRVQRRPVQAAVIMTLGAGLGTLLATLTKENGALLPALLLVTELVLLNRLAPINNQAVRRWNWLMLGLPTLAVLGYLGKRLLFSGSSFQYRDFTLVERLLTQCRILWDYIINLLLPRQSAVSPFADDYMASTGWLSPFTTLLGLLGLIAVTALAWRFRNRWPVLLFGWAFFLVGHLLESTVVALELYFAHRNHVPAFGLFFALAWLVVITPKSAFVRKAAPAFAALWLVLTGAVLADVAGTWGKSALAAEMWYLKHPASVRAAQYLAAHYRAENDRLAADKVLNTTRELANDSLMLEFTILTNCYGSKEKLYSDWQQALPVLHNHRALNFHHVDALANIVKANINQSCRIIDNDEMLDAVESLYFSKKHHFNNFSRHHLAQLLAELAHTLGRHDYAIKRLEEAFGINPSAENAIMIAAQYLEKGDRAAALARLDDALASPPDDFRLRLNYNDLLWRYRQQIVDGVTQPKSNDF